MEKASLLIRGNLGCKNILPGGVILYSWQKNRITICPNA